MKLLAKGAIAVAVALSLGVANAACNVDQWDKTSTAVAKSRKSGGINLEGKCALDASTGIVEKSLAGSTNTYFRFYVYVGEEQSNLTVFRATDGTNNADLVLKGKNAEFGGVTTPVVVGEWNTVEVNLNAGSTFLMVNGTKVTGTSALKGSTSKVVLGSVAGSASGKLFIDSFIASNDKVIPENASVSLAGSEKIFTGDADGNGQLTPNDAVYILKEGQNLTENEGVPDCDKNGEITPNDAVCALKKGQGLIPLTN